MGIGVQFTVMGLLLLPAAWFVAWHASGLGVIWPWSDAAVLVAALLAADALASRR